MVFDPYRGSERSCMVPANQRFSYIEGHRQKEG